jgi:hypothetical protein
MYSDNEGCIALAKNPEGHARSKHIDVQYHYTRQLVEYGKIKLDYCPTRPGDLESPRSCCELAPRSL